MFSLFFSSFCCLCPWLMWSWLSGIRIGLSYKQVLLASEYHTLVTSVIAVAILWCASAGWARVEISTWRPWCRCSCSRWWEERRSSSCLLFFMLPLPSIAILVLVRLCRFWRDLPPGPSSLPTKLNCIKENYCQTNVRNVEGKIPEHRKTHSQWEECSALMMLLTWLLAILTQAVTYEVWSLII